VRLGRCVYCCHYRQLKDWSGVFTKALLGPHFHLPHALFFFVVSLQQRKETQFFGLSGAHSHRLIPALRVEESGPIVSE
jgi:hypothetical protein